MLKLQFECFGAHCSHHLQSKLDRMRWIHPIVQVLHWK